MKFEPVTFSSDVWVDRAPTLRSLWAKARQSRGRVYAIPRHGDPAVDPEMLSVGEDEIVGVLAWRIHDLERQLAELRDRESVS